MTTVLLLLCGAGLVLRTGACVRAAQEAVALCLETVIPSLFPFMVLSSLLIRCGQAAALGRRMSGLMRPLFGLSGAGAGALALGLVGGYPTGARAAAELVRRGELSAQEGERLLAFCNNAGPGFLLGVCGAAVFDSGRAGAWLYLIHAAGAVLTGLLLRGRGAGEIRPPGAGSPLPLHAALPGAVRGACASMAAVCGFVVLFSTAAAPLKAAGASVPRALLLGALELTGGVTALPPTRVGFVACAAMLGWGGLSVHAQTLAMLEGSGLGTRRYFCGKALHALLSAALAVPVAARLF